MSDKPPPGPPPPPPSYPAMPPVSGGPPPEKETWKLWVGIGLAVPYLLVIGVLTGLVGRADAGAATIVALIGFVAPIGLLFPSRTVKFGLGLLIGYAALVVIGAGACIALFATSVNGIGG